MDSDDEEFRSAELQPLQEHAWLSSVEYHREISSTSDRALAWAGDAGSDALLTPRLVLAGQQTAGRGRGKNAWWSREGALTFSLVLERTQLGLASEQLPQLSLATALGVCDALVEIFPAGKFQLKWPNDVYLNDRKLAGMLLEAPPARRDRVVVGIGVNVNNSLAAAPEEIRDVATSLVDAAQGEQRLVDVLLAILSALQVRYASLADRTLDLPRAWRERCWLQGEMVEVILGREHITGLCHGLDNDGALLVQRPGESAAQRLLSGTVRRCE